MIKRRNILQITAGVGACLSFGAVSQAAEPGALTVVAAWPEGGPSTYFANVVAKSLGAAGFKVAIQYGADPISAARTVVEAGPAGDALFVGPIWDILRLDPSQGQKLAPVAKLIDGFSTALVVSEASPIKSWGDFEAAAKSRKLRGGVRARNDAWGITFGILEKRPGFIPFEDVKVGSALRLVDVVATGKADFATIGTPTFLDTQKNKPSLRPILTFGGERNNDVAVPTLREQSGDRELAYTSSYGVFAAQRIQPDKIKTLTATLIKLDQDADAIKEAAARYYKLHVSGPDIVIETMKREERVMKAFGG